MAGAKCDCSAGDGREQVNRIQPCLPSHCIFLIMLICQWLHHPLPMAATVLLFGVSLSQSDMFISNLFTVLSENQTTVLGTFVCWSECWWCHRIISDLPDGWEWLTLTRDWTWTCFNICNNVLNCMSSYQICSNASHFNFLPMPLFNLPQSLLTWPNPDKIPEALCLFIQCWIRAGPCRTFLGPFYSIIDLL